LGVAKCGLSERQYWRFAPVAASETRDLNPAMFCLSPTHDDDTASCVFISAVQPDNLKGDLEAYENWIPEIVG